MSRRPVKTKKAEPKWLVTFGGMRQVRIAGSAEQAINDCLIAYHRLGDLKTLRTVLAAKPYLREGVAARPATEADIRKYAVVADHHTAPKKATHKVGTKPRATAQERLLA